MACQTYHLSNQPNRTMLHVVVRIGSRAFRELLASGIAWCRGCVPRRLTPNEEAFAEQNRLFWQSYAALAVSSWISLVAIFDRSRITTCGNACWISRTIRAGGCVASNCSAKVSSTSISANAGLRLT